MTTQLSLNCRLKYADGHSACGALKNLVKFVGALQIMMLQMANAVAGILLCLGRIDSQRSSRPGLSLHRLYGHRPGTFNPSTRFAVEGMIGGRTLDCGFTKVKNVRITRTVAVVTTTTRLVEHLATLGSDLLLLLFAPSCA